MGIGAAFATGLVKGFTQNIEKEEARRLAEQAKIDAFEQTAVQALVTGKATKTGYNAVADVIKSARQQMKDRKPIDMFGRATDGIDIDFAKIQGTLEDASDYNFEIKGSKNKIGFSRAKGDGSLNDAYAVLSEYSTMLSDQAIQKKLRDDPALFRAMQPLVQSAQGRIMGDFRKSFDQDPNKNKRFVTPDIFGGQNSMFPGLEINTKLGESLNINVAGVGDIANTSEDLSSKQPGHTSVATVVEQTDSGYALGTVNIPDASMPAYTVLAGRLDMPPVSSEAGVIPLYNYWVGVDARGKPLGNQFFTMPGMTMDMKKDALSASMQIASYPDIEGFDPEAALYRVPEATYVEFSDKLNGTKAKTFNQKVMALAPYMKRDQTALQPSVPFFTSMDAGTTRQNYVLQKRYGTLAETSEKFTMDFLSKELENKKTAATSLRALQQKRAQVGDVESYEQFKRVLRVAFVGETSVRAAIQKDLLGLGVVQEQTSDLTDDFLKGLDERIKSAANTELAELEAMRISLAFQLARAADPSGRLSNQDIQQQLDRLGAGFMSKEEALAKIQVVIDELDRDVKKLDVFVSYGKGNAILTDNEARIIDAAMAVDVIENRASAIRGKPQGLAGGDKPKVSLSDYIFLPPTEEAPEGLYIDKNMDTVTDPVVLEELRRLMLLKQQAQNAAKVGT